MKIVVYPHFDDIKNNDYNDDEFDDYGADTFNVSCYCIVRRLYWSEFVELPFKCGYLSSLIPVSQQTVQK